MMQHASRFVLLRYLPGSMVDSEAGIVILVAEEGHRLRVVTRDGWDRGLSASDREYISELMFDWQNAVDDEIDAILEQLSEVSLGPLRALEWGALDEPRRQNLIHQINSGVVE